MTNTHKMIYKKRILRPSAIYIIILAGSMISYVQHEIFPIAIALGVTMLCYFYPHYISQNRDQIVIDQTGIIRLKSFVILLLCI